MLVAMQLLNPLQIDHRHHAANHGGELDLALGLEHVVGLGHVRSTKINRLGVDLLDTTARADGLVVDLDAGGLVVVGRPLGVNRRGEAGTGTGDFLSADRNAECGDCGKSQQRVAERRFHGKTFVRV